MSDREKWLSIGVMKKTAPTRTESQWDKDMPAYKRLRQDGTQPRSIDGCAELETRASTRLEIEQGHVFDDKKQLQEAQAAMRIAEDIRLGLA